MTPPALQAGLVTPFLCHPRAEPALGAVLRNPGDPRIHADACDLASTAKTVWPVTNPSSAPWPPPANPARTRLGHFSSGRSLMPAKKKKSLDLWHRTPFYFLLAVLVLAPLPFGAARPWAWSLLAVLMGLVLAILALAQLVVPARTRVPWQVAVAARDDLARLGLGPGAGLARRRRLGALAHGSPRLAHGCRGRHRRCARRRCGSLGRLERPDAPRRLRWHLLGCLPPRPAQRARSSSADGPPGRHRRLRGLRPRRAVPPPQHDPLDRQVGLSQRRHLHLRQPQQLRHLRQSRHPHRAWA